MKENKMKRLKSQVLFRLIALLHGSCPHDEEVIKLRRQA
jgi:hypothetical protein